MVDGDHLRLRILAGLLSTDGSPVVSWRDGNGELLLTPDEADQVAAMLTKSAESARMLAASVMSSPGALACFMSNPQGRA